MVEVHRQSAFGLGAWRRISGKIPLQIKHFSSDDKIYRWVLKRNNKQLRCEYKIGSREAQDRFVCKPTDSH